MADAKPLAEQPFHPGATAVTPWAEARRRLGEGDTFWLATARADRRFSPTRWGV
jgi:hypothetical protein